MALTCSLLGHDFDDYEVVREREERGSEVVTSIREVAVCERCGAERVLSENTEVTSIVDPSTGDPEDDVAPENDVDPEGGPEPGTDDDRFAPTDASGGETPRDDTAAETAADVTADAGGDRSLEDDPAAADVDDAELVDPAVDDPDTGGLDAEEGPVADAPADGPEGDDSGPDGTGESPDDSAEAPDGVEDDDAVILTDAPEERDYGEWPSHEGQRYRPWDPDSLLDRGDESEGDEPTVADVMGDGPNDGDVTDAATGSADAGSESAADRTFEETAAAADEATTFRCPECGFETAAGAVSLRRGDACPDCHTGYLVAERNP